MGKIFCGLDIGNSKLTAVLAEDKNKYANILASETLDVRGLSKGVVTDLSSLANCIQEIVNRLYAKTNRKTKRILISINGGHINARQIFAAVALSEKSNRHIMLSDINYLSRQARLLGAGIDETILHEFPQDYILDDAHSTFSPLGLLARKIQLNSYLLNASHSALGNITTAVEQAGYEVAGIICSGFASSFSVLSEEEKTKGVVLIDLGVSFSSILFFKDQILRDFKILPFGGNDITDSISSGLGVSWELADELKKSSLVLSAQDCDYSKTVVIKSNSSYKTLERRIIYESTRTKLEEFLNQIKDTINSSSWKNKIESGIVGIGGTANLEGILERIETYTGMPVKLGYIKNSYFRNQTLPLQYAAALGLIYYGLNFHNPLTLRNYFTGTTPLQRTANFLRNLYQEYF